AASACPASQAAPPPRTPLSPRNTGHEVPSRAFTAASLMAAFEVGGAHLGPCQQLGTAAAQRDLAVDHDVASVRHLQGMEGVLLDQQNGDALALVDLADDREDLLHH